VVLMRHGKAVSREVAGSDEERWLTEEGREDVRRVAKCLPKPVVIYTSPLRRARETAQILSELTGAPVEVLESLAPGKLSLKELPLRPGAVYVAHNPDLERLLEELGCSAKLSPGGAAVVDLASRKLRALLNPDFCP